MAQARCTGQHQGSQTIRQFLASLELVYITTCTDTTQLYFLFNLSVMEQTELFLLNSYHNVVYFVYSFVCVRNVLTS